MTIINFMTEIVIMKNDNKNSNKNSNIKNDNNSNINPIMMILLKMVIADIQKMTIMVIS